MEREAAARLRSLGAASAKRTQQYAGDTGTSDVVAEDELPEWHIEVKGTKKIALQQSQLRSFHKQVERDRLPGQNPVILIQCPSSDFIAMLPLSTWEDLRGQNQRFARYYQGKSVNPNEFFKEFEAVALIQRIAGKENDRIPEVYYSVYDEVTEESLYAFLRIGDWAVAALSERK